MDNNRFLQTKFDSMVTNRTMQLIKAIIPYIDNHLATVLGVYIKLIEVQNTMHINQNISITAINNDKHNGFENMLEDMKDFLSDEDKETFDTIINAIELMSAMGDMDADTMKEFMNFM